jgi:hypothetical protein
MSRRRRNRGDNAEDLLNELQTGELDVVEDTSNGPSTASDFADVGYGTTVGGHDDPFAKLSRNREKIVKKAIDKIIPNRTQPRRALPSAVRQYWDGEPTHESMATLFERWQREIEVVRQSPLPLDDLLLGQPTERVAGIDREEQLTQVGQATPHPLETSLMKVIDLAASIKRDGLTNPISVAPIGLDYEIETGERRWLAYHLLNWRFGMTESEWQKIPTRQVDHVSLWRQATENNARDDLNAIGKARQFALLLMDILTREKDSEFQPYEAFTQEQDFYAQVSDGTQHRVPRGAGEQLLNAMGLENSVQLRQYRALLRLPHPAWVLADDLNWTESFIRAHIAGHADDDEDIIRNSLRAARQQDYSVSIVTAYEHLLADVPRPEPEKKVTQASYQDFVTAIVPKAKLVRHLQKMKKSERKKAIAYLEELLEELREI